MSRGFLWPALVSVLALLLYQVLIGLVGQARGKFNVQPPATTGHPDFERRLRVQLNTSEQLICFLPALWLFAMTLSPTWGAALGGLWIFGRIAYAVGYFKEANKRVFGFAITSIATGCLLLGSVVGIGLQLFKSM